MIQLGELRRMEDGNVRRDSLYAFITATMHAIHPVYVPFIIFITLMMYVNP